METSSTTILAYERENQKLRADVAELVKALDAVRDVGWFNVPIDTQITIDFLIAKHGGQ